MGKTKIAKSGKPIAKSYLKIINYKLKIVDFIKSNQIEVFLLVLILVIGGVLRLYKIDQYMTFLGDEGRDAIIVRNLLVHGDPILIGPGTSIGNMYLGPLYYYLMAPALLLSNFHPVGPAIMIGFFGMATIFLVWLVCRELTTSVVKDRTLYLIPLLIAFLYAISPVVIIYSRSSWNPNIMPFFALLSIYSVWKVWTLDKLRWLIVTGFSLAFVLQSHYLGVLLLPILGLFWGMRGIRELKRNRKEFIRYSLFAILLFAFLMSPLLIFDMRHDFMNFNSLKTFLTERQTTVSARPWTAFPKMFPLWEQYVERIIAGKHDEIGKIVSSFIIIGSAFFILKWKKIDEKMRKAFIFLMTWITFALVGFGIYKQHIYDHYFGFIYPVGFLLLGLIFVFLVKHIGFIGKLMTLSVFLLIFFANYKENPLHFSPNNQYKRAESIAQSIIEVSEGKPFNFAVLAKGNYETGYSYFFDLWGSPNKKIVDNDPKSITDQLLVVCEITKEECDTPHNSKTEVAHFGWSTIVAEWNMNDVIIQKLIHAK